MLVLDFKRVPRVVGEGKNAQFLVFRNWRGHVEKNPEWDENKKQKPKKKKIKK